MTSTTNKANASQIKALVFDVFGTLVDWRTGIAAQAKALLSNDFNLDWDLFADSWRAQYQPSMQRIRSGQIAFCTLDTLHMINLNQVIKDFKLEGIEEPTKQKLNLAWHTLNGWSDTQDALHRMRKHFLIAPCSNGNISLMIDLARHNNIQWDAILGAEIAGNYKPHPIVYQRSVEALGLKPHEVVLVAAHSSDLEAASAQGLKTAFVTRPFEFGGVGSPHHHLAETKALTAVDFSAKDLSDLADQLGA
jgi:2-haloacid dehalogenase